MWGRNGANDSDIKLVLRLLKTLGLDSIYLKASSVAKKRLSFDAKGTFSYAWGLFGRDRVDDGEEKVKKKHWGKAGDEILCGWPAKGVVKTEQSPAADLSVPLSHLILTFAWKATM